MSTCNYSGYDYQHDFWGNRQRQYEDQIEKKTITSLLSRINAPITRIMDAGCGFGRLFPAYKDLAESFYLLDYADNMLEQAKVNCETEKNIDFIRGELTKIPVEDKSCDCILSVRTVHHLEDPSLFFNEISRVLKPGGHLLIDIPNKRHLKNIIKYMFGSLEQSPFDYKQLKLGEFFYNYHPNVVNKAFEEAGLTIKAVYPISFFRSETIKAIIPTIILVSLDRLLQKLIPFYRLTPSLYYFCQKR